MRPSRLQTNRNTPLLQSILFSTFNYFIMKKDILYSLSCLAFAIIIGGAVYEHLNVVPKWAAAPPVSLSMFQGEYGLKPELFWMVIHPLNMLLFIFTLVLHWRSGRRKNIVIVLASYILILIVTSIYFVPELIDITTTALSQTPDPELTKRASLWETLSIVRLGILVVLAIVLFTGLTKATRLTAVER
jgi:cytochrome bd-type quinol oxidase subunit 2